MGRWTSLCAAPTAPSGRGLPRITGRPGAAGTYRRAARLRHRPCRGRAGANSLDVFVQGTDHVLSIRTGMARRGQRGTPSAGFSPRHPLRPHRRNGVIDVFVRGTDGAIWYKDNEWGPPGPTGNLSAGSLLPAPDPLRRSQVQVVSTSLYKARTAPSIEKTTTNNGATWSGWTIPRRGSGSWFVTRCDVTG